MITLSNKNCAVFCSAVLALLLFSSCATHHARGKVQINPPPDSSKELENLYEQQGEVMEKEGIPPEDDSF